MKKQIQQTQTQKITKNMLIAEILAENPEKAQLLSEIMIDFGIHCVGCGASAFETLEQGVLGHGYSEADLNKLVKQINEVLEKNLKSEPKNIKNFSLKFTRTAIEKIKHLLKQEKEKEQKTGSFLTKSPKRGRLKESGILRISVLSGGCSGFVYNLEIINKPIKSDLNFKKSGIDISVAKNGIEMLDGIEIDFVDNLNESGFKFNNPNAQKECGCGKSFK
ncbi:MAG: iron-sulfur cluster insertion protein erpA [archaeon GW2011_AR19]|nr:MAG: iron-sulfur cluster insertion protein erpA [archaeon GW2011_AR19]